jgi:catechol-2,3-dioxygenase
MIFEHFALNVANPVKMAKWYANNLNMEICKSIAEYPFTHFLADHSGRLVMELYSNENAEIIDYQKVHPLQFHIAFASENAEQLKNILVNNGATVFEEHKPSNGTHLVMLRDPFGVALQICQRADTFALNIEKVKKYANSL